MEIRKIPRILLFCTTNQTNSRVLRHAIPPPQKKTLQAPHSNVTDKKLLPWRTYPDLCFYLLGHWPLSSYRRYSHQDAFNIWDVKQNIKNPDCFQSFLDELAIKASQLTASCLYQTHWTYSDDTLKSSAKCVWIRTTNLNEEVLKSSDDKASVLFTVFMLTRVSLNCKCAHLLEHWPLLC